MSSHEFSPMMTIADGPRRHGEDPEFTNAPIFRRSLVN